MRTTISISDELLADAKRLAADKQSSLSAIISDALRQALKDECVPASRPTFVMPTYGGSGMAQYLSPADMAELVANEELQSYQ